MIARQFWTWTGHAAIAAVGPALVGWLTPQPLLWASITSTLTLAVFVGRELRDRRRHAKSWNKPMDSSGVTPRIDMWGDLMGPATATVVYWTAWLL